MAHSIAVIIYHILRDHTTYQDLGGNYFDERDRQAIEKRLVRRLQRLGYQVELRPVLQTGISARLEWTFSEEEPHVFVEG